MINEYNSGDVIFRQGDLANEMYDILSGTVGIYTAYGTEKEQQIDTNGAGQFIGEMGLVEAYPRSLTAVALEDGTRLQSIDEKEFSSYFRDQPERVLTIMRQLSHRLRKRTAEYNSALRTLEELQQKDGAAQKRSGSFLQIIKKALADHARAADSSNDLPD